MSGIRLLHIAAIACIGGAGFLVFKLVSAGFDVYKLGFALALIVLALAAWFRARSLAATEADEGGPLISLVLLFSQPLYLEDHIVAPLVGDALGEDIHFGEDEPDESQDISFVVGQSPLFMLKCSRGIFMINNFDSPYFDDPDEVAEDMPELRRRKAIQDHAAWLSVDFMQPGVESAEPAEAYRAIGSIIAQFGERAAETCLAVLCPESLTIEIYDEEMSARLRGPDPLAGMVAAAAPPVVRIKDDDPRLLAAVQEARERWPEFVEALAQKGEDDNFAVKAPLTSGGNTEFIWISVLGTHGDVIFGVIDNDPVDLPGYQAGDQVEVELQDLNDWIYSQGDRMEGGFTVKVLQAAQEEQIKASKVE